MKYKLIVRSEAEAELADAYAWYEQHVTGLGDDFIQAVDAAINSIRRNPLQYPVVYKAVRRVFL